MPDLLLQERRRRKRLRLMSYDEFVRCWQTLDERPLRQRNWSKLSLVDAAVGRRWSDRYPAGGGFRILRRLLMDEE